MPLSLARHRIVPWLLSELTVARAFTKSNKSMILPSWGVLLASLSLQVMTGPTVDGWAKPEERPDCDSDFRLAASCHETQILSLKVVMLV